MNIGDKILNYRKSKGYSQEDIANKLNVSRQTISKWETNQSMPDFDKIVPLCELFDITTDELLKGTKTKKEGNNKIIEDSTSRIEYKIRRKFALCLSFSIFLYFISIMWVIFADGIGVNDSMLVVGFLGIIALATVIIVYSSIVNKQRKKVEENIIEENSSLKKFKEILGLLFLVIYLVVSFLTMAWHITWIIWIIYAMCEKIVILVFKLEEK